MLHKKDKKSKENRIKLRSESEETSKVTIKEEMPDNGSVSSGVSDTKSCGSDHEMIPLSQLNRNGHPNKIALKQQQGHTEDDSGEMSDGDNATTALIMGASEVKQ